MANVKLVFSGTERSNTDTTDLQCFATINNEICIDIDNHSDYNYGTHIYLDRSTAIKLHRELKKQISFLENESV